MALRAFVFSVAERVRAHRWARALLQAVPMAAIFSLFVVTGIRGVDFGYHWDEGEFQIRPVSEMVSTGLLMPHAFGYPGFSKWLTLLPVWPVAIKTGIRTKGDPRAVQAAMLAKINAPDFLLTVRRLYVVFSALTIVWVWAAALALRRPWWEAAAAAAAVGLSWEYAYHARWVATDCPLVQFSALTLFMLALYFRERRPLWIYAGAAAAGFGAGSKYQGAILLLPVLLAGVLTLPTRPVRGQVIRIAALSAIAFAVYLITTPATIFEPFTFVEMIRFITKYYETGHLGYSVSSTWEHLRLVLLYLSVSLFSPHKAVALALFASSVVGAIFWMRSDRRVAAVLACFPVAFLLFFCVKYRVMIVRNYLLVMPFLALFAGRGLSELGRLLPGRWLRWSLAGAVTAAFVAGGAWLVSAGESIRHPDNKEEVRSALAYVAKHTRTRFQLSPQVRSIAKQQDLPVPPNARAGSGVTQVVFFPLAEGGDRLKWKTNDPWLTKAVFGPREVNLNWYFSWEGADRVVIMTTDKAKPMEFSFVK